MAPTPDIQRDIAITRVTIRFFLRMAILTCFAFVGRQGFATTLESLMSLAACYCIVVGGFRRVEGTKMHPSPFLCNIGLPPPRAAA